MNLKSYDKSTKILKLAELAARGVTVESDTNMLVIGVVDCAQKGTQSIKQNLAFGIRKENGIPLDFEIANFTYPQRVCPATAKYAANYVDFVAKSTEAIARTNLLDGMVAIVDNNVTAMGVLQGCTKCNCPVLLMPTGLNPDYKEDLFAVAGKLATREIKSTDLDQIANTHCPQMGIAPADTLTIDLFKLVQAFNLMLPNAVNLHVGSGELLNCATATGSEIMKRADDIITTKRLISKRTLSDSLVQYCEQGGSVSGLLQCQYLLTMVDLKMPTDQFVSLKGFVDQAYVVSQSNAPLTMQGQAWVYRSLTDAMTALCSNAIDNGIVVLQHCTNCDVSIVAKTIVALHKENEIAIMTDGYCSATPVLTIANITPDAFENQDFANIQNGDQLEIDTTKGRINTNVTSKDMKTRAKRNIVKKHEIYF